jgi:hypothetical protein
MANGNTIRHLVKRESGQGKSSLPKNFEGLSKTKGRYKNFVQCPESIVLNKLFPWVPGSRKFNPVAKSLWDETWLASDRFYRPPLDKFASEKFREVFFSTQLSYTEVPVNDQLHSLRQSPAEICVFLVVELQWAVKVLRTVKFLHVASTVQILGISR